MKNQKTEFSEKHRGIFDRIENAITYYLKEKKVSKIELWSYGINVFELSLFIEEYLITGNTKVDNLFKK